MRSHRTFKFEGSPVLYLMLGSMSDRKEVYSLEWQEINAFTGREIFISESLKYREVLF